LSPSSQSYAHSGIPKRRNPRPGAGPSSADAGVRDRKDFDDPKLEYRRLFSELLGTFMLVLVAGGGGILHGKGQISLAAAVVAPGLMVLRSFCSWAPCRART
jgi:hypothetical protein